MHHVARGRGMTSFGLAVWLTLSPLIGRGLEHQVNCIPAKRATKEDTGSAAQSHIDFLKVSP